MRKLAVGGFLLVVAAAVVGIAIWWFAIREDAELATEAPAIPSDLVQDDATPPLGDAGIQTFVITPERSEAAYFADEQLASLPLPSRARGSTNEVEGEFHLTEDGFALASQPASTFRVDLTGLASDESRRDRRVQGALETALFPTATFTVSDVTGYDPSVPDGEEQDLILTGRLELHGVQKDVAWDVQARREGNVITALATITFRFDEFGIDPPNFAGFVSVGDEITLQLQLVAEAV